MNGVQLGFPDSVSRVLASRPRGYAKPQYIEYNPESGNNILHGQSEFSSFHDRARADMMAQLDAKKRDASAREKRFLMGNPMPKLPMHSWTSAGSPFMMADKTVPMGDSGLRGGIQPNYTPEALAIQRKMLKRRANEAGVISRNELPPPTLKPRKSFAESLKDVIDTVLISIGDAIASGNYDRVAFEGVYKLIRSLSENGQVFEKRDLLDFLNTIEPIVEDLRGVITEKVQNPNTNVGLAKGLYASMTRVREVILKLLKNSDKSIGERQLALRSLISDLKKEKAPEILEKVYDEMMSQVMSEVDSDRGTVFPRTFAEIGELPMDAYREDDEATFDPYAMEGFSETLARPAVPRVPSDALSAGEQVERDMSYMRFLQDRDAIAEEDEAEEAVAPSGTAVSDDGGATMVAPDGTNIEAFSFNGVLVPASSTLLNTYFANSLANLRVLADSIGYRYSQFTDRPNLKRGIISKIRKVVPNY
jgi:hypothetical protein